MEIKIRDMLQGGYMPPFTYYQPVLVNDLTTRLYAYNIGGDGLYNSSSRSSSNSSSKSDDESKGRITLKDLMAMLEKVDGLPSDMKSIFNELMEFEKLLDIPFVSSMIGDLSTQYISTLQDIKQANFNKKLFDNAYELLAKKNALDEIAINKNGNVYVEDPENGLPKEVSVDEYASGNYNAYTNSNLLYLRANELPNKNRIFDIANNAISMQDINNLIHDYLSRIGTSENSTSVYEKKQGQKIQQGLDNIQAIEDEVSESGVDGLYKSKNLTKQLKVQGALAIEYIWNMLPKNALTLLKIKAKEMGAKTDDVLVRLFVGSSLSDTVENTDTLVLDAEGKKLGSKSSTGTSGIRYHDQDPVTALVDGSGAKREITLNAGTSAPFLVIGRASIITSNKNELKANSTFLDLLSSDTKAVLDTDNATMGGSLITGDKSLVLIQDPEIVRVELPVDQEAKSKGIIKPDFELQKKVENAESLIADNNIVDLDEINNIYISMGLPAKFRTGKNLFDVNTLEIKPFAIIKAKAEERAFKDGIVQDLSIVNEIDDDILRKNLELIFKENYEKYNRDKPGIFTGDYDYYEGFIYIPIIDSHTMSSFGYGNLYESTGNDKNTIIEKEELIKRYNQSPSLSELR